MISSAALTTHCGVIGDQMRAPMAAHPQSTLAWRGGHGTRVNQWTVRPIAGQTSNPMAAYPQSTLAWRGGHGTRVNQWTVRTLTVAGQCGRLIWTHTHQQNDQMDISAWWTQLAITGEGLSEYGWGRVDGWMRQVESTSCQGVLQSNVKDGRWFQPFVKVSCKAM